MSQQPFILKNAKQKLTRHLHTLNGLLQEAREFEEPWQFPTDSKDMGFFLISKEIIVNNLITKLRQRRGDISEFYAACNQAINSIDETFQMDIEKEFDDYWLTKKGEDLLQQAEDLERQLEIRLLELQCQEEGAKRDLKKEGAQSGSGQFQYLHDPSQPLSPNHYWTMERRLVGNELRVPNFHGSPSEFDSFWELFEELVHKQPYSNIEKLSILLNCCKGDAARTLQMIPRTGESYERAVSQLITQYKDPRRITIQMIRKLKSMKQCQDDPRSLRNNLSDVQAIISTLEKQGEAVNTTNMRTMVLETFSKNVQDEMAKKEFDSGNLWSMADLLDNLSTAIRRKEHVDSVREPVQSERSVFHSSTTSAPLIRCIGCGHPHRFAHCNKYWNTKQKIGRLRDLNACWKCFSIKHRTAFCRKQNCLQCGGPHNYIICRQNPTFSHERYADAGLQRTNTSFQQRRQDRSPYPRRQSKSPKRAFKSRSYSPRKFSQRNTPNPSPQRERFPRRSPPRQGHGTPLNTPMIRQFSSPSRMSERQVRFRRSPTPTRSHEDVTINFQVQNNQTLRRVDGELTVAFTDSNSVRLMVAPVVMLSAYDRSCETVLALLDSASDQSFISTSLAKRMNLDIKNETTIMVKTFGGRAEKKKSRRVITCLYNMKGDHIQVELLTSDQLTSPLRMGLILPQDSNFLQENFSDEELKQISRTFRGDKVVPEILIGMDYFNAIIKLNEPVLRLPSGLFLTPTFFGPVISGMPHQDFEHPGTSNFSSRLLHTSTVLNSNAGHVDISDLWKLNMIGIEDISTEEEINKQIVADFYSTVQMRDNKIFVRFPWKSNRCNLANNYNLALSRLHQLFKMKERNPHCWKEYCNIIEEQLQKNFIEDAPQLRAEGTTPCYYIPHQAVIKSESATTKTRIVLDASSKMKGELSLNDVIHQGPLILPHLCGVLIRSRIGSKIMIADVEKAFHMIHLHETERDAVRFLWLKNTGQPPAPGNLRILRFCRLPFGINASPFLLGISIKYGIEQQTNLGKDFQKQLNDNLYVDNVLLTADSTQTLIDKYQLSKQVFDNMAMNLRQFMTNDEDCNKKIAPQDLSTNKSIKILGIPWNSQQDTLSIKCKLHCFSTLTKRKVLQATHSTFDPLGLLIPLLLPAKIFLQDLWKGDYKWDDELPPNINREWQSICERVSGYEMSVPRAVTDMSTRNRYEIHTFVDASLRAFAAAAYLRSIAAESRVRTTLLMARQRLAPVNKNSRTITIPRLELLALLIGIRLTNFVIEEIRLPITEIRVFSDSQVTLNWIQSSNHIGTFVDNRCREIRTKLRSWSERGIMCHLHYISSELNPADCATKGLTKVQMENHIWWSGPPVLMDEPSNWPKFPEYSWIPNRDDDGVDSAELSYTISATKTDVVYESALFSREYSSFKKFKRILSLVMKFLKYTIFNKISMKNRTILKRAIPEIEHITAGRPLMAVKTVDLAAAERTLITLAQKTVAPEQLAKHHNLQLYKDENGIIRCRGRIQARHLAKETQEPILLPGNHNFTKLLIKDVHHCCGHQGVNGTLANLRLNYWLPKGRQIVKKWLKSCMICKRWNSKPFFYPNSPQLPRSRTEPTRPFLHVGIDLAGPFRVRNVNNEEQKKWVLLTTCMVTRAVHFEIINSLSAMDFIHGLRRFVARRGKPKLILSDNATNFTAGREIMDGLTNSPKQATQEIQNFLSHEGLKWKFITPLSPWKGGFYERMIGVMKSILKKTTRRRSLQEDVFATVIPECEAMVNSRPLTYTGTTVEDSAVLRPIDFIIPYANVNLLPYSEGEEDDTEYLTTHSTKEEIIQNFQRHLQYLQNLWSFWTNNYLLELRNFHQSRIKQKNFTRKQPYIGEVVLIMEANTSRGEWPLGLVTKLIQDHDGEIRSVELKTAKSNITRSINQLIPLEIEESNGSRDINEKESINDKTAAEAPQELANGGASVPREDTTAQHVGAAQRTRPWLPRRAKEHINYCVNNTHAQTERPIAHRSSAHWHRWLMFTLLASLCAGAHSEMGREKPEDIIQCTKGGVFVRTPQIQDKLQICANDYCLEIHQPEPSLKVQFPAEITLHSYHVVVKMSQGNSVHAVHWACSPSPFCEQIACTFCTPMVTNPDCWPRVAIVLGAALFYIILMTVCVILHSIRKLYRRCRTVYVKINAIKNSCFSRWRNQRRPSTEYIPLVEVSGNSNRKWKTSTFVRILTICAICSVGYGCQQVILVPSTVTQCNTKDQNCSNITTILAKFNTMQSELCLQVQYENFQVHLMTITLEHVLLRCQKETLYFTQNTKTHVQSRKRCPSKGSCTGLKCAGVSTNTMVKELDIANNFTGITYCTESCGFWGCSCGFPSSGCLFYRIYHIPTDNETYEVFQCPTWYETIKLKIEQLDTQHTSKIFTGELKPYTVRTIGDAKIEVTSFYVATTTIQYQRFLTNKKTTSYLDVGTEFTYACSRDPSVGLNSSECSIRDTCNCNPAENTVSCYCTDIDISQIRRLSNTLPLPIPNGVVLVGPKGAPKIQTKTFSIELAIHLNPTIVQLQQQILHFNCNIIPRALHGCYSCFKGAVATIACTADVQHATAQVTCGIHQFVLKCTRHGYENQIKLFFDRARVREQCRVQCGNHTTIVELQGTLNYINGLKPFLRYAKLNDNKMKDDEPFKIEWDFPDISHFIAVCKEFYLYTVIVLLTFPSFMLLIVTNLCARTTKCTTSPSPSSIVTFASLPAAMLLIISKKLIKFITSFVLLPLRALIHLRPRADRNDVEQQQGEEEVPVEPEQEEQHNEEQDQAERRDQWPVQAQEEQDVHEEIAAMDRKVNRILGRTDEIHPIKVRLSSTYKTTHPSKKAKLAQSSSKTHSKSLKTQDESLLHVVDQRTIDMKNVMDRTINGLEQIYDQHKELLKELRTQTTLLQGLYAPRIPHNPPSSSSDRTNSKDPQLSCAFCAGNHHACDCNKFTTLQERRRRLFDNNRCERCLKRADHMATTCATTSSCWYCRVAGREEKAQTHHSAFCNFKFKM